MPLTLYSLALWLLLLLIQVAAAIPWAYFLFVGPDRSGGSVTPAARRTQIQAQFLGLFGLLLLPHLGLFFTQRDWLEVMGGYWGSLLQLQLTLDAFLLFFYVLLLIWPKGGAVALAAFREGVRQPMFWLLTGFAFLALTIAPFVPYFTFGEDYIMVKELGYDTLMLAAVLFGTLAASMFIAEEIEGRTAVTVMSKPISRRQFLLGKFVGITFCALLMYGLLACYFAGVLDYKFWWDRSDPVPAALWVVNSIDGMGFKGESALLLLGIGKWINHALEMLPALVLSFCEVMVLISVAVTLATRLPMVVNMSAILVLYLAAHLTPVLVAIGQQMQVKNPGTVSQLVSFTSQMFETILPGLQFFRLAPALIGEMSVLSWAYFFYVGSVLIYATCYTAIVLLLGLILFEDRDLA